MNHTPLNDPHGPRLVALIPITLCWALLLAPFACSGEDSLGTQAERAVHATIGSEYQQYVLNDPALSEIEKQNRMDLLAAWGRRILAEETSQAKGASK